MKSQTPRYAIYAHNHSSHAGTSGHGIVIQHCGTKPGSTTYSSTSMPSIDKGNFYLASMDSTKSWNDPPNNLAGGGIMNSEKEYTYVYVYDNTTNGKHKFYVYDESDNLIYNTLDLQNYPNLSKNIIGMMKLKMRTLIDMMKIEEISLEIQTY